MKLRRLAYSVAAGLAVFLVVAVLVTELLSGEIEFSLFVGLPAGFVAGTLTSAFVAYYHGRKDETHLQAAAAAFGVSGTVFLLVLLAAAFLLDAPVTASLIAGAGAGVVAGAGVFVWKTLGNK